MGDMFAWSVLMRSTLQNWAAIRSTQKRPVPSLLCLRGPSTGSLQHLVQDILLLSAQLLTWLHPLSFSEA